MREPGSPGSESLGRTPGQLWGGALEALAVVAAFVVLGTAWASVVTIAREAVPAYPPTLVDADSSPPHIWLVDGFNVVHTSGLLGAIEGADRDAWWKAPVRRALMARAAAFDDPGAEIWVVFDGPTPAPEPGSDARVRQVFAPSADDWLLARLKELPEPGEVALVTADTRLADRARHRGARIVSPIEFIRRCAA